VELFLRNFGQIVLTLLIPSIPRIFDVVCFEVVAIRILTQKTNHLAVTHKEPRAGSRNLQLAAKDNQTTRAVGLNVNAKRRDIIQAGRKQGCLNRESWLRAGLKAGEPLD
jgi:hypothetical protein